MSLARLVVTAVRIEGRTQSEVAREVGVSRRWVHELVRRFDREGEAGLEPRSRRPRSTPSRTSDRIEDEIVGLRKELAELGVDAGAQTIRVHLVRRHRRAGGALGLDDLADPRATGVRHPQPHKRPVSSLNRFVARMPNELWQADITHWELADGAEVEILNVLDDDSRLLVASDARGVFKAADVVASFHRGVAAHGMPASLLTDNAAVFTAAPRGERCAIELECARSGVGMIHSRPYHPQTCGKVERFHQTLKRYLAKRSPAGTLGELQAQLDTFRAYYNTVPPHRAIGRRTPAEAFAARPKASPSLVPLAVPGRFRLRRDKVDSSGVVTLRHVAAAPHRDRAKVRWNAGARARRPPRRPGPDRGR